MTDSLGTTSKAKLLFAGEKYPAFMMTSITKYEARFSFINHKMETTYSYTLNKAMFKNYKVYDDYVYTSLKNTNTDSISGAILFFILILLLYVMFSKNHQKKPFESLLLIAETKKTQTPYVSVMKHDNCELDI